MNYHGTSLPWPTRASQHQSPVASTTRPTNATLAFHRRAPGGSDIDIRRTLLLRLRLLRLRLLRLLVCRVPYSCCPCAHTRGSSALTVHTNA